MQFRKQQVVIGTRGSVLARAQADIVRKRLQKSDSELDVVIQVIVTSGDKDQKSRLGDIGGKGIFIKELEQALLDGTIDLAVHSFKDVTSQLAPGLSLTAFRTPESVCDVMITRDGVPFAALPQSARIGTGSVRRKALLARMRNDLFTAEIRGNIDTRLSKVDRGDYDAIMLSEAGLIRLGLTDRIAVRFDPNTFYPAPGQGVITIETRADDTRAQEIAALAGDSSQRTISTAELALLTAVGFDCRTPLGVYTTLTDSRISMRGFFISPDSNEFREGTVEGDANDSASLGNELAEQLLQGSKR